jgi:hypothetical protein
VDTATFPSTRRPSRLPAQCDRATLTPRDALVEMLRAIDAGEINPSALIIANGEVYPEGDTGTGNFNASAGFREAIGQLNIVAHPLIRAQT